MVLRALRVVEGVGQRGRPASRAASRRARTVATGHSRGTRGRTNRPPQKAFNRQNGVFSFHFSDFLGRHQESMRKCKKVRQSSTLVCALSISAPLSVDPGNPPSYDFSELNASSFRFRGRQFHGACAPPFTFGEFMGPWNEVPGSED